MKKPNYYYRLFRQNHSKAESMEMLLNLADYKRISGQITNEQFNLIADCLNLKRGLKTRLATPRNEHKEYEIVKIVGNKYTLKNKKTYNYNELYFK